MRINVYWDKEAENCIKCKHSEPMSYHRFSQTGYVCSAPHPVEGNEGKYCISFEEEEEL